MAKFKEKLLVVETLNEAQKMRLLEQMAYELQKASGPPAQEDAAAAKIQAIQRKRSQAAECSGGTSGASLEDIFSNFCAVYRQTSMTNTVFAKFCKDSKLLDKKFTKPDIDMVWSKAAGKEKKVGFPVFIELLKGIAAKKSTEYSEVEAFVLENAKVTSSGTKGESRFYDDKSQWTGSAVNGGPTNNDNVPTLASMTASKK